MSRKPTGEAPTGSSRRTPEETLVATTQDGRGARPAGGARGALGPDGRFQIERRIGAGAMGVVFEAFDRERGAEVALKTLHHIDADGIYHLKREFRSLAGFSHPNLVQLHELVADGDQWFLTMELVRGVDFLSHVRGQGPDLGLGLAPEAHARLRPALRQLVQGIAALHGAGKLHRDIKPSNALVTPEGRVVLLDFGLVTDILLTRLYHTMEPRLVGTPAYLAPEQAAAQPLGPACDFYAVGVLLYQALTGALPFEGNLLAVLRAKQDRDAPPPRARLPGVPADLDALCEALLRRRPEDRPGGAEILARLDAAVAPAPELRSTEIVTPVPRGSGDAGAPWVGRAREAEALAAAFAAARGGRTVVALVHGSSGLGKTALVGRFLAELARQDEIVVLAGRCYERELVPYRGLDSVVDALTRHLARLPPAQAEALLPRETEALVRVFPVLRRVPALADPPRRGPAADPVDDPQERRRRAVAALRELLGRIADRQPLVVCIDDLQWGDADSAALLVELVRAADAPALLLVLAYRSEDAAASPCLRALRAGLLPPEGTGQGRDGGAGGGGSALDVRDLPLPPLGPAEARGLALALLGGDGVGSDAEACAATIAREAGGNAFFVQALVDHVRTAAGPGLASATGITLDEVLRSRVARLPLEARRLLVALAVAGRPLARAVANEAAGLPAGDLGALSALRAAHLVRARGGDEALVVDHDRVREAVVAGLTPAEIRAQHARLAEVQAGDDVDPETRAFHLEGAGEAAAAGAALAVAAARADEALAFERAARLYRRALELGGGAGAQAHLLEVRLADALANLGRGAEAAAAYLDAAASAPGTEALELYRRAAEQRLRVGHLDEGLATLRIVLDSVGAPLAPTPRRALLSLALRRGLLRLRGLRFRERDRAALDPAALLRLDVFWSVSTALGIIDNIRATDFQSRHLLAALSLGEPYRLARALAAEVGYSAVGGAASRRRTARLVRAAEDVAARVDAPFARGWATLAAGMAAYLEGRHGEARALCERAEGTFRGCVGVWWEVGTARLWSLWALYYLGQLGELSRRLPGYLHEAEARGDLYTATNLRSGLLVTRGLLDDDPARAAREVAESMGRWSRAGFHTQHYWQLLGEASIALYEGDGAGAWARLDRDWERLRRSLLLRVQTARVEAFDLRGRCALARAFALPPSGERDRLVAVAEGAARRLARERVPWASALAGGLRAGALAARGDGAAAAAYDRAAETFAAADMALHAAAARACAGKVRGGAGGDEAFEAACAWARAEGARRPERLLGVVAPGRG